MPEPVDLFEAALVLDPAADPAAGRRVSVRIMPFGEPIVHSGERVQLDAGGLTIPDLVPVNVDHGDGVLHRVGRAVRVFETSDGLYADLLLSDTTLGRDVATLLADGVVTDVSAGVRRDRSREYTRGNTVHMAGDLAHVAFVGEGAFGPAGAGSKVLSVHSRDSDETQEGNTMPTETPTTEHGDLSQFATSEDIQRIETQLATLTAPAAAEPDEPQRLFRSLRDFVNTQRFAQQGDPRARTRMEAHYEQVAEYTAQLSEAIDEFALADDTTTTAAGLVPDYLSSEIISRIQRRRPYVSSTPNDPIGPYGMSVVYPKVVAKPDVDVQATEKTEVATQAMDIDPVTVDLVTYAGASDVSLQLIERSQPSFLDLLFRELAGVYAGRTEAAAIADAVANAGNTTTAVANFTTDPAASWAAAVEAVGQVASDTDDVEEAPVKMIVASDRWAQLLGMVDSDGRPILDFGTGDNSQGSARLNAFRANWGGLTVIRSSKAAAGTAVVMANDATAVLELAPQQLRALQVDLLGVNAGVWGLFAHVVKYADSIAVIPTA